jgi:VIT1/CCC1 family predicted Fe2+/Mn2+ transporter
MSNLATLLYLVSMSPEAFARNEYRDWVIYRELAAGEHDPHFKAILSRFVAQEHADFLFWRERSRHAAFSISMLEILWYKMTRRIFGLAFTAKLLEGRERDAALRYEKYLTTVRDPQVRTFIEQRIAQERAHEQELIGEVEAESVKFVGNIVLGVNDGLVELSGALTGFALVFQDSGIVALSGVITGIAAALSMAASAYLSAEQEEGKNAKMAGLATGASYLIVVAILVAPFLLFSNLYVALILMFILMLGVVAALSFYTAILSERRFARQFRLMLLLSLGVAAITFVIGLLARQMLGVSL